MVVERFPDPRQSTPEGIIALGGDLEPETLLLAYQQGIFPWPMDGLPLAWFCPPERAILEVDRLHIPRSLERIRRKAPFRFTVDQAFETVISECAKAPRPEQEGTWITHAMKKAYVHLHDLGHAHSIEAWNQDVLVGGLYGVDSGGVFSAESMFYKESNASKLAVLALLDHIQARGLFWLDIQVLTPHMEVLGAREISRDEFLKRMVETQTLGLRLFNSGRS